MNDVLSCSVDLSVRQHTFAIVAARFNDFIVEPLIQGAIKALQQQGAQAQQITLLRVPGAFELPLAAKQCAQSGRYTAIIALGAVIKGATLHFDFVAGECARGLGRVATETGVPIAFGVLTTQTVEQAMERAGPTVGNKGAETAMAAIEMANLLHHLKTQTA